MTTERMKAMRCDRQSQDLMRPDLSSSGFWIPGLNRFLTLPLSTHLKKLLKKRFMNYLLK